VQTPARAALGQRSGAHAASAQRANATAAEDSWEEF